MAACKGQVCIILQHDISVLTLPYIYIACMLRKYTPQSTIVLSHLQTSPPTSVVCGFESQTCDTATLRHMHLSLNVSLVVLCGA